MFKSFLIATSAIALSACATTAVAPPETEQVGRRDSTAHTRLHQLFADSNEAELQLSPMGAIYRGDFRQADKLTYSLTPGYYDALRANARDDLARLAAIDYAQLSATDQIAYDVFKYNREEALEALDTRWLALTRVRPLNHFLGLHSSYPNFAGLQGPTPFKTVEDYENANKRHADYARYIDRAIAAFREGMASGVVESRLTVSNMIAQLETQLAIPVEDSPFYAPLAEMPASIGAADRQRLTAETTAVIESEIYAANRRLLSFLRDEYLARARKQDGLSGMKGGAALYRKEVEERTTLPLEPADVHALGLSEVARIHTAMRDIMTEVGFKGTLKEFFEYVRTDPRFAPTSREGLGDRYREIGKIVDTRVGRLFAEQPATPLEIRPYEPYRERYQAGASYQAGAPDASRPGIFYYNAYDLPSRRTPDQVTLYLHEAVPGHHFAISLQRENAELPDFLRFGGYTAFSEGWALYAETLGYEMGLYDDPWDRYGTLSAENFRSMRLVVDTGIHSKGWSRQQAIDYMLANSEMSRTVVENEVDRYIAWPGQALAYKIGALKIQELRKRAEQALGDRFDIRDFHEQVLGTGGLPLTVLEKKIDTWIAGGGGGS